MEEPVGNWWRMGWVAALEEGDLIESLAQVLSTYETISRCREEDEGSSASELITEPTCNAREEVARHLQLQKAAQVVYH